MIDFGINQPESLTLLSSLTPRAADVVKLLSMGEPPARICAMLGVSMRTFEMHVANTTKKWQSPRHGFARIYFAAVSDSPKTPAAEPVKGKKKKGNGT